VAGGHSLLHRLVPTKAEKLRGMSGGLRSGSPQLQEEPSVLIDTSEVELEGFGSILVLPLSSSGDRRLSRRSIGRVESVIRVDGESKLRPVLELFDKKSLDLGRPSVPLVAVDRIDGQIIGQVRSQLTVIVGIESRDPIRKEFFEFR
jgi:hypothetical protein